MICSKITADFVAIKSRSWKFNALRTLNTPYETLRTFVYSTRPSRSDQPAADRIAHEGGRLMNVQLPHQVDTMRLNGFDAQPQVRCDLLRRLPVRDPL
jgi:hypothetical protein